MWISNRQTATSRSTTEAEMVSLATALFSEAMPCMDLWELFLGRPIDLYILEDNEATIKVAKKGYSSKLRHCLRHHKINLGSAKEAIENNPIEIVYCHTNFQAADVFTKALEPHKWDNALALLGVDKMNQTTTKEPAAEDHDDEEVATEKLDQECKMTPPIKGLIAACTAIDSVAFEFQKYHDDTKTEGLLRFAGERAKESGKLKIIPKPRASAKLTHWGHLVEISAMPKSSMFEAAQEYDHIKYWRTQAKEDYLDRKN
jgi:hypothetical protein